jgi:flavin reductase (DIM6/NTAB) family NADH-FMN oxidoreductase RutF
MIPAVVHSSVEPQELRRAYAVFPSGVVALLGNVDGTVTGLAVSAFASVSLSPPLVAVFLRNDSVTWPSLRSADRLGISVLRDGHGDLARQLAGPVEGRLVDVELCDDGVPLIADSAARFEVTIDDQCPAGDHTMVLLRVHRTEIDETLSPLIFHRSGFATLR